MSKKFLIVVGGPTASGKSALAVHLANYFNTAVLSADSRQFYKEMSIGTAKITPEEQQNVPHYFVDNLSIHTPYSVGDFEREALACLETLFQDKNVVVLCGGTGLYIQAVCEGLDHFPDVPLSIRDKWQIFFQNQGLEALQMQLKLVDPVYFEQVDVHNPMRLMRALAVHEVSGQPFSHFLSDSKACRPFTPLYICLDWPRPLLYDRINRRVDMMLEKGLLAEAERLLPYRHLTALQTVGYTELFDFFEGQTTLNFAIDKIKQHSRNYAKRQMTWFRRADHWHFIAPDDTTAVENWLLAQMALP